MIEFRDVTKIYDSNGTHALEKVNLKIEDGEFVFVVGSSGAGKSTFLKLIMHEEKPTEGEVIVNGYSSDKLKKKQVPYYRRTMGIVFQDFRIIPKMSVYDNVAFAMRVIGAKEREYRIFSSWLDCLKRLVLCLMSCQAVSNSVFLSPEHW